MPILYESDGTTWIAVGGGTGPAGPVGPGVPAGGTTGQVLTKTSGTDYATAWQPVTGFVPLDGVQPATTRILASKLVSTDVQPAFQILGDGTHQWGPGGGAATDTSLRRLAAATLNTPNALTTGGATAAVGSSAGAGCYQGPGGTLASVRAALGSAFAASIVGDTGAARYGVDSNGKINWADGTIAAADTNLYRWSANLLRTDGGFSAGGANYGAQLVAQPAATTTWAVQMYVAGEAQPHFYMTGDGKMNWGLGGSTAPDTNLYRSAANTLAMAAGGVLIADHQTSVASVTTARTGGAAAALPAAPVKYLALRDETGARVYVPAYS